jgi:asparagine synthase (glutamine-hydrolysing)
LPLDRWFRTELRELAADLVTGRRTRARGFFDAAVVDRLWTGYLGGRDELFMPVWTVLNFEVWCRTFLDRATG